MMGLVRAFVVGMLGVVLGGGIVPPLHAQWVEPPGTGWAELRLSHHQTQDRFNRKGEVEPYFNKDAQSTTQSATFTGALGLWQGLDTWLKVPFHRLQFDDVVRERTSTGLGDPRFFARVGPNLFGIGDLATAVALRGGMKVPIGDFENDVEVVPLSEGQRDWEVLLEIGKSLHPWPVYVMGWVGYRWRETNPTTGLKPGNERLVYVAAGGSVQPFRWKVAVDGFFGRPTQLSGATLSQDSRRELLQVIPTVGWRLGPGTLEVGAEVPLHGRNLPAGPTFTLDYFVTWNEALW